MQRPRHQELSRTATFDLVLAAALIAIVVRYPFAVIGFHRLLSSAGECSLRRHLNLLVLASGRLCFPSLRIYAHIDHLSSKLCSRETLAGALLIFSVQPLSGQLCVRETLGARCPNSNWGGRASDSGSSAAAGTR
jgi:hypothetical protein